VAGLCFAAWVGHVSAAEKDAQKRDEFFAAMSEWMLRSNVPNTLPVNAAKHWPACACFVLDVPDRLLESWITPGGGDHSSDRRGTGMTMNSCDLLVRSDQRAVSLPVLSRHGTSSIR